MIACQAAVQDGFAVGEKQLDWPCARPGRTAQRPASTDSLFNVRRALAEARQGTTLFIAVVCPVRPIV